MAAIDADAYVIETVQTWSHVESGRGLVELRRFKADLSFA